MAPVSIHQVRADGSVVELGEWVHAERRLVLHRSGFPLLGPGDHRLESELPWVFWDMCPTGYMAREFLHRARSLALPAEPRLWTASDCLTALSEFGSDLSGNLIAGSRSLSRWDVQETFRRASTPGAPLTSGGDRIEAHLESLDSPLPHDSREGPSSLGGERPKFIVWGPRGVDALVKFSPPRPTELGQRWWDLLHVEALCAQVLRNAGIRAVDCHVETGNNRALLWITRFDRLAGFGRRGAATLNWYAMTEGFDTNAPAPSVISQLVDRGALTPADLETVTRVHAFSRAIGNNDAHLGNYGLTFDDDGTAHVAPFYDIVPMALAPRNDELRDARLQPITGEVPASVRPLVDALVVAVTSAPQISKPFVDTWLRHIGR